MFKVMVIFRAVPSGGATATFEKSLALANYYAWHRWK